MKEITIERGLSGDFFVGVYVDKELQLDKKYFCRGQGSAFLTALELQEEYPDYSIEYYLE